jgi:hypothetical protein
MPSRSVLPWARPKQLFRAKKAAARERFKSQPKAKGIKIQGEYSLPQI